MTVKTAQSWLTVRLCELCERIDYGYTTSAVADEVGPKFLRITDIVPDLINWGRVPFCQANEPITRKYNLRAGDIVIARTGATTGYAKLIRSNPNAIFASYLVRIRTKPGVCSGFVGRVVESSDYKRFIQANIGGAAQPQANAKVLTSFQLALPPLPMQERIADILSAYDDLIENNARRIQILEQMAQMLYREWFVNFRFPDHEKVKMVESKLGLIPEKWTPGILRDVCSSLDYGYTASAVQQPVGPKFLRITDIVPSTIDWQYVPYCSLPPGKLGKYRLNEGDIVVARTGATTGYAKRMNKRHPESVFASYLVRLGIKPEHSSHLFGVLVESDDYKRFITANLGGAAQPQANAQVLTSIPVLIPPQSLQQSFSSNVEPLLDKREILQIKNLNLRSTRDLLLPKLVSGEVGLETLEEEVLAETV